MVVAEAADGDAALAAFDEHRPDLAFLDIRMPGRSGLDVAAAIGNDCHVVFITAYDQYALKAFEAGAVDYLLKPVEADRLATAVDRVRKKLSKPPADLTALVQELRSTLGQGAPRIKWIKAAIDVPFGTDRSIDHLVGDPRYAEIRTQLHQLLRPEVDSVAEAA